MLLVCLILSMSSSRPAPSTGKAGIAAAAEEHGLTVLHYDTDFDLISRVTAQPCEWIVGAGVVD